MKSWKWYILYFLAVTGNLLAIYDKRWIEATYCTAWMIYCEIKIWRTENSDR